VKDTRWIVRRGGDYQTCERARYTESIELVRSSLTEGHMYKPVPTGVRLVRVLTLLDQLAESK
jgi:hypothetical protein